MNVKVLIVLLSTFPSFSQAKNSSYISADNSVPVNISNSFNVVNIKTIQRDLPDGERWISHVENDLLKFWGMETALGNPIGDFPTYRCNDGSLYDEAYPCSELKNADSSIVKLDREYTRSKSRQIYGYGIAYHLTGDEQYLYYAVSGADWLIDSAFDKNGAVSWYEQGNPQPIGPQRTSQDMAYAASGIAFLYYLTRDSKYLNPLIKLKEHIFNTYFDKDWGILRWVIEKNSDGDLPTQKELVSQLDQIYGYMLWTTMALPDGDIKKQWREDLNYLATVMRDQFFGDTYGLYWGAITDIEHRNLADFNNVENPHTDFGHSIKTLWLTYRVGLVTQDTSLVNFSRPHMYDILERAFIEKTGSWARGFKPSPEQSNKWILDENKEWWSLAELDQTSATLALVDPIFASVLPKTYDYWFKYMVDHTHGGVWHMVNAKDNKPDLRFPKQHSWKNAFHVFEHALISYVTTQQIKEKPATLHYAFRNKVNDNDVHPYLFYGEIVEKKQNKEFSNKSLKRYSPSEVNFRSVR